MFSPYLSLIAAVSENGVIGKDNKLPWHLPADLKRFKELTAGHVVIMGRKTFESIGRPLPNRTNIVITHDENYHPAGVTVLHSLSEALQESSSSKMDEVFVIGGAQVYKEAIGQAQKLYLTLIHKEYEGDAFFPDYSDFKKVVKKEDHTEEGVAFTFLELER